MFLRRIKIFIFFLRENKNTSEKILSPTKFYITLKIIDILIKNTNTFKIDNIIFS